MTPLEPNKNKGLPLKKGGGVTVSRVSVVSKNETSKPKIALTSVHGDMPVTDNVVQPFNYYEDIFELSAKGMSWQNIRTQLTPQYGTALLDVAKEDLIKEGFVTYNQYTDKLTMLN